MWIFNLDGFFSVVEHRNYPGMLLIRARYREDLVKVARKIGVNKIQRTPMADYPCRIVVTKAQWVVYMAQSAAGINYDNFKNAVLKDANYRRAAQYHEVWATMAGDFWLNDFEEDINEQEKAEMRHLQRHDSEEQGRRRDI